MSLRTDAITDFAELTGVAALGSTNLNTMLVWWRPETLTGGRSIIGLGASSRPPIFEVADSTHILARIVGGSSGNQAVVAVNTWYALAITRNGNDLCNFYLWSMAGVRTDVHIGLDSLDSSNTDHCILGDFSHSSTCLSSWRYWRYWARVLSATELDAEVFMTPSSGTPAASTTSLRGSWAVPDATTTTDWSSINQACSIGSGATSGEEPTIPSAGGGIPKTTKLTLLGVG